ncbi:MAG: ABC transporter ATP-binding protein [Spirochaetes bacterium]|jgi:branched-chain amino acid transport system ATP-binding protein|nr:ABC transporter ATP-binding protein [Spirochaetota bacterium]
MLLEVKNVSRAFGGLRAVDDVSFSVPKNSIKAIIGPNGAGKTTLFNLISGSLRPDSGRVFFNGRQIQGRPPHTIAARGVSRTFQNIKLFHNMTVLENVMVGRHTRSRSGFMAGIFNLPSCWREEREIENRSRGILDMLGVSGLAGMNAGNIAFGSQRIVEFARALALEPELLLLDEPAAGLNMHETAEIAEIIRKIREMGVTILIIEHDMSLIMDISDDIVVLSSGKMIAEGRPSDIQKNPEVIRIYLGEEDAQDQEP